MIKLSKNFYRLWETVSSCLQTSWKLWSLLKKLSPTR